MYFNLIKNSNIAWLIISLVSQVKKIIHIIHDYFDDVPSLFQKF
jgi:hypothetical protein